MNINKLMQLSAITTTLLVGASAMAASSVPAASTTPATTANVAAPINLNTADVTALESIKGLGSTKAQAIVDYRAKNGNFKSVQDLQNVPGIGPKLLQKIQSQVTVS